MKTNIFESKKILSIFLAAVMILSMLPMNALTAFAADTSVVPTLGLYVNGTQVTGIDGSIDGYTHSDLDAGWSYDTTTGVLTLTNATLTTDKSSFGGVLYWTGGSLTIELVGTNTLDGEGEYPIFFKGDTDDSTLTIRGSGSLIVNGGIYCEYSTGDGKINITRTTVTTTEISVLGDVTITDSTVISDGNGWAGIYSTANVTITNSTVVAKSNADSGGYGIQGDGTLSISNS